MKALKRLRLKTDFLILWLQVKLSMEPQPQPQTEPQSELNADDAQKTKNTQNSDADCSHVASDPAASVDAQKNKGWYIIHDKTEFMLINGLKHSTVSCPLTAASKILFENNF